jgi:hypothetical protein
MAFLGHFQRILESFPQVAITADFQQNPDELSNRKKLEYGTVTTRTELTLTRAE